MDADDWRRDLRHGLRHARDLESLPLSAVERARRSDVAGQFKVAAPRSYLDLIDWSDPADPIALQTLPDPRELRHDPRELADPIGDDVHRPVPRLTHRYPDRALLYPTYQCAVYCRHCFRREAINAIDDGFRRDDLRPALDYIANHGELREVILTGGDPLVLGDEHLTWLRAQLEAVPQLRMLRVHTRIPVVLPSRVTDGLIAALVGRQMVTVVLHVNHPREITPAAADACTRLRRAGFMLLNQSVLLRGINDDVATLETLCQELVYTLGAKPYYLHHCDLARGVGHFRTEIATGQRLMRELRGRLSGVCMPTYVLDLPGGHGKVPIESSYILSRDGAGLEIENGRGSVCRYEEVVDLAELSTSDDGS